MTNARLVASTGPWKPVDIVIDRGSIVGVHPAGTWRGVAARRIDAKSGFVIPGLVNAHLHSHEFFMKGSVWGLPLEPYMLKIVATSGLDLLTPEDIYTRTLASCAELIRGGVTLAIDDVIHPSISEQVIDPVLQAYEDSGMRACVTLMITDRPWIESIPFLKDLVPEPLVPLALNATPMSAHDLTVYRRLIAKWNRKSRVRIAVSPSAPERCSPQLLKQLADVAQEFSIPFHVHVQESLSQAIGGPVLFGQSMTAYLASLGILTKLTTMAHAVWLDDRDIDLIGSSGAIVVHNPASNMKLGSGVARVRDLLSAGVTVALGCDGYTCNDSQDMFEAMKLSCLLSAVASPDNRTWLSPDEAIRMATITGTRAAGLASGGEIAAGQPADLVILDPRATAFLPVNDPVAQLVFAAKSSDVRTVIVEGRVILSDGQVTSFDTEKLWHSVIEAAERYWDAVSPSLADNMRLTPYFDEAYRRAISAARRLDDYRLIGSPPVSGFDGITPDRPDQM